jgi:predicted transcriptional regulator
MLLMNKRIIFKVGHDMTADIRQIFKNPKKYARPGTQTIYFKDWEDMLDALSPQKMRLLQEMLEYDHREKNVKVLARQTNRKQEAVSRDIASLAKAGLITKTKKGKSVYPRLNAKEIVIQLA